MFAFFYFTLWSILLLIAESLLRSVGLSVPLLGFFFAAAAIAVSPGMAFGFALASGIAMDFVLGYTMPWDGLMLPLLTIPAFFLKKVQFVPGVLEFLAGAIITPVMALPHIRTSLTTPDGFASLLMCCLFGAVLFPIVAALISHSSVRLKIGLAGTGAGGA